jgi:hypothetical protein
MAMDDQGGETVVMAKPARRIVAALTAKARPMDRSAGNQASKSNRIRLADRSRPFATILRRP